MSGWAVGLAVYIFLALATFLPVLRLVLRRVELFAGGPSFRDSLHFSNDAKLRLEQNYDRMRGTLGFWKTQANRFKAIHTYSLVWATIATVMVPFFAQAVSEDIWSKWFVSVVGAHAALVLALSRAFKVESNYKAFRQGESDFYDLYRRFLDRPELFGSSEAERLDRYFEQVDLIRRMVRSAETDNLPSIEEMRPHQGKEA